MSLMFFLWICLFIPNVPHSFQPIDVSHIQNFMVQRPFIKGCLRGDLQGRVLTFWGGLLIRCWHYMLWVYYLLYIWYITHIWIYIYMCVCVLVMCAETKNFGEPTLISQQHQCWIPGFVGLSTVPYSIRIQWKLSMGASDIHGIFMGI